MKVKMVVSRAGAGFCDSPGDHVEVDEAEAGRMIAAGQAEYIETATKNKAPENASKKGNKKK